MRPSRRDGTLEIMRLGAVRRPELWLAVVVLAYLGVAATYNYNTPIFETPDEIFHYLIDHTNIDFPESNERRKAPS